MRTNWPLTKEEKILKKAQKRLKQAVDFDAHNRKEGIEDLKFLNGEQWDNGERTRRKQRGRPVLQINLLPKFVDQVVGEERHNRPKAKVRPVDSKADIQIAKIREGLISAIEYQSDADSIYDHAYEMAVSCGYGAWRVLTRYTEENPFIQEVYLESIKNPFLVFLDPSSKHPCYADAQWGFVLEKVARDEFEERYPDAEVPGFELKIGQGLSYENWYDKDTITIAEYFTKDTKKVTMCQMEDGSVLEEDEAKEKIKEWKKNNEMLSSIMQKSIENLSTGGEVEQTDPTQIPGSGLQQPMQPSPPVPPNPMQQNPLQGNVGSNLPMVMKQPERKPEPKIVKRRETEKTVIKWYTITACEILSKKDKKDIEDDGSTIFPGKYIPIVVVKGKERNIEGKTYIRGLVRDAKDPQKLVNYWNTAAAETIALAPKAPWLGTAKQFEGYEADYANANSDNFPFLKYNPDTEGNQLVPPPQRMPVGQPPVAIFEQIRRGEENLKSVIGMFNSDLGDVGPERTGAAIRARQTPGDISTYIFMDNLARSIKHSCKIINEMLPYVYDTERDIRLRNIDDTETYVPINTTVSSAFKQIKNNPDFFSGIDKNKIRRLLRDNGPDAKYNDITVGKYDINITVGPSYATARQESAAQLLQLVQAMPREMAIAKDIIVENLDFKDNEKLAKRLRKTLPPNLVEPREGEPPQQPMPPPPQIQVQMQKVELEKQKVKHAAMKIDVEKVKLLNEAENSKGKLREMIIEILMELHGPEHPADKAIEVGE